MVIYFSTRAAARSKLKAHKLVDNGPDSPKGKRFARELQPVVKVYQPPQVYDIINAGYALAA